MNDYLIEYVCAWCGALNAVPPGVMSFVCTRCRRDCHLAMIVKKGNPWFPNRVRPEGKG
jgi:hypothetical protein